MENLRFLLMYPAVATAQDKIRVLNDSPDLYKANGTTEQYIRWIGG